MKAKFAVLIAAAGVLTALVWTSRDTAAQPKAISFSQGKYCVVVQGGSRNTFPVPDSWGWSNCQAYMTKSAPGGGAVYMLGCIGSQTIDESAPNAQQQAPCWK